MKPRNVNANAPQQNNNSEQKEYVHVVPEDGLQAVQIGLLVDLGNHKKLPKFAKDNAGKREQDEDGNDKIIFPKEGKDLEQKVAAYVDLLDQTHDYEGDIGVKNMRFPLHPVNRGMSEGLNFTTVAPRDPDGNYIKGRPWLLASTSQFYKIAGVVKYESGEKVSDVIFKADYKNSKLNDISEILGKPFMFNVDVKKTMDENDKEKLKYVNVKMKSPVPLMKGMKPEPALTKAISVNFEDDDLLEPKDELGGVSKFDLIRVTDLRKIVLAVDYPGSKMQAAVQEKMNEAELIQKAKEIQEKILENDKELKEIQEKYPDGFPEGTSSSNNSSSASQEKPETPKPNFDDMDDDIPF